MKIIDSIDYIDEVFLKASNEVSLENAKGYFNSFLTNGSYVDLSDEGQRDLLCSGDKDACNLFCDETKKNSLFGKLPIEDTIIQITKYALIKSYDDNRIPGVQEFKNFRNLLNPWCMDNKPHDEEIKIEGIQKPFKDTIKKGHANEFRMFLNISNNRTLISRLVNAFIDCRYRAIDETGEIVDHYNPSERLPDKGIRELVSYLTPTGAKNKVSSVSFGITNFIQKVRLKKQAILQQGSFKSGKELYAMFRSGKSKNSSEVGSIIRRHPENKSFKLMAIAENRNNKNMSAKYALEKLNEWFSNLDESYYEDDESLKELFKNEVCRINYELLRMPGLSEIDLSVAITGKTQTMIYSFGKVSAYQNINGIVFPINKYNVALGTESGIMASLNGPRSINNSYVELMLLTNEADYYLSEAKQLHTPTKPISKIKSMKRIDTRKPMAMAINERCA